jgi:alcohol dehydrogenase
MYSATGGPISVTEVPDPVCPPGGAVLAVRATGICRSDWHAWRGHETVALPHIGGHEYAGEIAELATDLVESSMTKLAVGDRVTVPFVCGCGACDFCRAGDAQVCPNQQQPGFDLPGSFAEFVAVPAAAANLVHLPDSVTFTEAAALGCRFATAFRAITAHGRVAPGQWVGVVGCGGVGLSAVMIAVALGARVVAVDVADGPLTRAKGLGAEITLNAATFDGAGSAAYRADDTVGTSSAHGASYSDLPAPREIGDAVIDLTGGCHVSLDALGSAWAAAASVHSLRRRGRHVQVGLLHGGDVHPPVPMDRVIGWELEILGSHGMSARDYPQMLDMVTAGTLRPAALIAKTIGLDGIGAALAAMDRPGSDGITVALPTG